MPPSSSKRGSAGPKATARDRRSISRHSTPVSALTDTTAPPTPLQGTPSTAQAPVPASTIPKETPYTHTPTAAILNTSSTDQLTLESLIDRCNANGKNELPSARALHELESNIRESLLKTFVKRGETANASMRQLVQRRKERERAEREVEAARAEEVEAGRLKREKEERKKSGSGMGKKRAHEEMEGVEQEGSGDEEDKENKRDAPTVGAHGLARQDGVGVHEAAPPPPSPPVEPGTAAIDPMDTAESPSDTDGQPQEPSSTAPLYERAFGKDPTQFDDPTVYDIRPISENLSKDEIRDILNVATWPESDLRDLTAGDPPDQDFSNAKPANQVNFSTFQTYVEPYIRPYTEEDVSFLKERGDRFTPYVIPNRGPKGYKEVWAAEDGLSSMGVDAPKDKTLDPNEARGSIENMDDSVAETDEVSLGPLTSRLLSLIRPVPSTNINGTAPDNSQEGNKTETTQTNNVDTDMPDANNTTDDAANPLQSATPRDTQTKPTTYLPSSAPRPSNLPNPDHATYEARALAELRYIGFLPADQTTPPDYSEATDDEVCARLRTLQHALRDVSARNNLRRQRVLELTYERMAMQEYANIADDLDNQVNAAYLKRNRSLAKPAGKKGAAARSGGGAQQKGVASAAGTGAGGRGVSEGVKALMEKRGAWRGMIGGVVGFGRQPILDDDETVFGEEDMKRAEAAERELEAGEEGEA